MAEKSKSYKDLNNKKCNQKISELLLVLPEYVNSYYFDISNDVQPSTALAYLNDITRFMKWLSEYKKIPVKEIPLSVIESLSLDDINKFRVFLKTDQDNPNSQRAEARKMSALRSLYDFLIRSDKIVKNPLAKMHKQQRGQSPAPIIRLQPNETAKLIDCVEEAGRLSGASDRQQKFLEHSRVRDLAILTLLLGTGIRVSECVGLDIKDVRFDDLTIELTRKGNKKQKVAMSDEVVSALKAYLEIRRTIEPREAADANAFFLSSQHRRIGIRAVQNLVKKYSKLTGIDKPISPHKLRKTYGTELYNATGDIYLVARALGHNSVNTTKNHYIMSDEDSLLQSRNAVKLRSDSKDKKDK